jgi:hypothetical protein
VDRISAVYFSAACGNLPYAYDSATGSALFCHSEEPFGHAQDKFHDEESVFELLFCWSAELKNGKADASLCSA